MKFEEKRIHRENVYLSYDEQGLLDRYSRIKGVKKSKIIRDALLSKIANDTSLFFFERAYIEGRLYNKEYSND